MTIYSKIVFFFLVLNNFSSLHAQVDSVLYQRDSVIEQDCTDRFFQRNEKITAPGKVLLITKTRKTMTLANFLKSYMNTGEPGKEAISSSYVDYVLSDLDNDGKKELVISNFTGGAHCCDEFYFFRNVSPNKYQYVAKTFAGDVCITEKSDFFYSFYQNFGYFFTCFACGYIDTSDTAPVEILSIALRYNKGKVTVVPGDKELRSIINDNLGKLGEQPNEKLDDAIAQDNGLRKELAMNLAVFYYSFGRNLAETQKLFNKYYKFPDAKKVWAAFVKQLQFIRKDNDF